MLRAGVRSVLELEADMSVVAEASDGTEAVLLAKSTQPDAAVMDISMPGLSGIEATRGVLEVCPACKVVALSANSDAQFVYSMFNAGASAYLPKTATRQELVDALRAVQKGQKYVSPTLASVVIEGFVRGPVEPRHLPTKQLSARETEVLTLLAEGASSKEIAVKLHVEVTTVETFRRKIMGKLGVHTVAELTKFAIRSGLTNID